MLDIAPRQPFGQRATAAAPRFPLRRYRARGLILGRVRATRGDDVGQHLVEPQLELLDLARQPLRGTPER